MPKAQKKSTKQGKTKYDTHVLPRLVEIEAWCRDGMIDEDIAAKLGIAYSTFREYTKKYLAFSAALKRGKDVVDIEVENALLKRALGYRYVETTKEPSINPKTGDLSLQITKEVIKEVAPDVGACAIWLKNRRPDIWRDKREMEVSGGVTVNDDTLSSMMDAAGYKKQE